MTYFITAIQSLSGSIGELKWKASISEMQLLDTIIGSFLQVLLFSLIPFLTWLIFARKKEPSFFKWIGLTKPAIREWKLVLLVIAAGLLLWVLVTPLLNPLMNQSATTDYSRDGFTPLALIQVLFMSFIKTGLSEEILFRGFLGKRLISKFGFAVGNTIQAVLFGAAHSFIILSGCGIMLTLALVAIAAVIGWLQGLLNEKAANGSIFPSFLLHGISNTVTGVMAMF